MNISSERSAADGSACAVHPEAPSVGTCGRCGSFMCVACDGGGSLCRPCIDRQLDPARLAAARASRFARYAFFAYCALTVADVFSMVAQADLGARMSTGEYTDAEIAANDVRVQVLGFLDIGATLVLGVAFCVWMNRSFRVTGKAGEYGPGSWAWFIAPIFNLWKPYQAISALYEVRTRGRPAPAVFQLWWVAFIAMDLMERVTAAGGVPNNPEELVSYSWTWAFCGVLGLVAAYLATRVIDGIDGAAPAPDDLS
jgi:hypothetical protein